MFLYKITPVSILCLLGIIYLVIQFFIPGRDYNIFAYLVIFIILLAIAFAADRFLVSKIAYKKLFIFELLFLAVGTIWYLYANSYTQINIETGKPYFFVVYDHSGLKKADIPAKGVFNKSITITSDSNVHIHNGLEYDAQVNPPASWHYAFSSTKKEANINAEKVVVQIFARKLSTKDLNEKLEEEIARMQQ